jgi:hypothetical protein
MMNQFFRTPPPADEGERKVARAIAWLASALWAVIVLRSSDHKEERHDH